MNAVKVVGAAPPVEHCVLLLSSVMLMRHSSFVCLLVLEVWLGENKDGSVRVRCAVGSPDQRVGHDRCCASEKAAEVFLLKKTTGRASFGCSSAVRKK